MGRILWCLTFCIFIVNLMTSEIVSDDLTPSNDTLEEKDKTLYHNMLENIKVMILKKLDLKEPPNGSFVKPPLQYLNISRDSIQIYGADDTRADDNKSFAIYSIVHGSETGVRFTFNISKISNATSCELWLNKNNNVDAFTLIQRIHDNDGMPQIIHNITIQGQGSFNNWIRFEILPLVLRAQTENFQTLDLQVICTKDCPDEDLISDSMEQKPFIIVSQPIGRSERSKRHLECGSTNASCCRDRFYVSFAEIGYGDWILQPEGYNAYYCRGSCRNEIGLARNAYVGVLMTIIETNRELADNLGLSVKCTANKMSHITFIYRNETDIIVEKNATNMVVQTCDCA